MSQFRVVHNRIFHAKTYKNRPCKAGSLQYICDFLIKEHVSIVRIILKGNRASSKRLTTSFFRASERAIPKRQPHSQQQR